ncbi:formin-like protein 7 isoform X2 [Corapipo altera]|uniref:formin-like protein 7 isoform X2 n=1 Tax=Corapipo altera TaxID=415028 RepID=UPI000FD6A4DB|nr:formin-like protein 7 isoform X2 [Corapipo altera]
MSVCKCEAKDSAVLWSVSDPMSQALVVLFSPSICPQKSSSDPSALSSRSVGQQAVNTPSPSHLHTLILPSHGVGQQAVNTPSPSHLHTLILPSLSMGQQAGSIPPIPPPHPHPSIPWNIPLSHLHTLILPSLSVGQQAVSIPSSHLPALILSSTVGQQAGSIPLIPAPHPHPSIPQRGTTGSDHPLPIHPTSTSFILPSLNVGQQAVTMSPIPPPCPHPSIPSSFAPTATHLLGQLPEPGKRWVGNDNQGWSWEEVECWRWSVGSRTVLGGKQDVPLKARHSRCVWWHFNVLLSKQPRPFLSSFYVRF